MSRMCPRFFAMSFRMNEKLHNTLCKRHMHPFRGRKSRRIYLTRADAMRLDALYSSTV